MAEEIPQSDALSQFALSIADAYGGTVYSTRILDG
jgi:hypothetical protein